MHPINNQNDQNNTIASSNQENIQPLPQPAATSAGARAGEDSNTAMNTPANNTPQHQLFEDATAIATHAQSTTPVSIAPETEPTQPALAVPDASTSMQTQQAPVQLNYNINDRSQVSTEVLVGNPQYTTIRESEALERPILTTDRLTQVGELIHRNINADQIRIASIDEDFFHAENDPEYSGRIVPDSDDEYTDSEGFSGSDDEI